MQQVLDHLLKKEHPILDRETAELVMRRFDPDAEQADALLRLRAGTANGTDRLLLRHEFEESEFMRTHPGATYDEAHAHATGIADWYAAMRAKGLL